MIKHFFLIFIRFYWVLIPESKRRKCIFRESCSKHVFEVTSKSGFWKGVKAFKFRYKNCRQGYQIFQNPINNKIHLILPNRDIINEENIAKRLLK
ncbi:membrane protein insertion efficiency factor YidD [uncultured Maribacter sp.]|uniref:membrane protein insertion efficiency factor YidD n=1 Tax=uncultured Maribacter sp. TaxID=431308 RepID=UPI00260F5986|nr:membrane protein insertion efficiency factor YidD [uncultured Maribacter sp.]